EVRDRARGVPRRLDRPATDRGLERVEPERRVEVGDGVPVAVEVERHHVDPVDDLRHLVEVPAPRRVHVAAGDVDRQQVLLARLLAGPDALVAATSEKYFDPVQPPIEISTRRPGCDAFSFMSWLKLPKTCWFGSAGSSATPSTAFAPLQVGAS